MIDFYGQSTLPLVAELIDPSQRPFPARLKPYLDNKIGTSIISMNEIYSGIEEELLSCGKSVFAGSKEDGKRITPT